MIVIEHRINTLAQLRALPPDHGAEIDLRSDPKTGEIYLHHDPFVMGQNLDEWLGVFGDQKIKGPLILNTKEDGLEKVLIEKCLDHNVQNFFFLDTALPTLVKWSLRNGENRFACRLSVYEPVESVMPFAGKVQWLWVDCFEGIPLSRELVEVLRKNFRICLVSPELQGVPLSDPFIRQLRDIADAVCTKQPQRWQI